MLGILLRIPVLTAVQVVALVATTLVRLEELVLEFRALETLVVQVHKITLLVAGVAVALRDRPLLARLVEPVVPVLQTHIQEQALLGLAVVVDTAKLLTELAAPAVVVLLLLMELLVAQTLAVAAVVAEIILEIQAVLAVPA
jgi:uncharacterized membrane protein